MSYKKLFKASILSSALSRNLADFLRYLYFKDLTVCFPQSVDCSLKSEEQVSQVNVDRSHKRPTPYICLSVCLHFQPAMQLSSDLHRSELVVLDVEVVASTACCWCCLSYCCFTCSIYNSVPKFREVEQRVSELPDRPFHSFSASQSGGRRFLRSLETSIDAFRGT